LKHRLIAEIFPIKEISDESSREKNIQHGHISAFHIWWARRPLAATRSTIYASLVDVPKNIEEWGTKSEFITKLSKWDNSTNFEIIKKAREDILTLHNGQTPKILDPFSGGGAIPFESLRLGCETYAGDYNPVSVLLLKCILEFPQRFSGFNSKKFSELIPEQSNRLVSEIEKWSKWVLEKTKKEIEKFYPTEKSFSAVGYLWARTIVCQNPSCGVEIPLMRHFWLSKTTKKKVSLYPVITKNQIKFKIVGTGYADIPKNFDPSNGTISRAITKCLVCGNVINGKTTSKLFRENNAGERMLALVLEQKGVKGKTYRVATEEDIEIYVNSKKFLEEKVQRLNELWHLSAIPDEPTPEGKGKGAERAFSIRNYKMMKWGDLFNSRQKLAMVTFVEKVREGYEEMLKEGYDSELAKAVTTYNAILVDRLADKNSNLVTYDSGFDKIAHVFGRQALGMVWDYVELNPFTNVGWKNMTNNILNTISRCSKILPANDVTIKNSSATSLDYPDNYFDAVFTDPPYYDNIPYSYLSDFFYVWLKRSIGHLYPDLFLTPLTPKSNEIVVYSNNSGGWDGGVKFFETMLKKSFQEIYRVLKPDGVIVVIYAHKSTQGWEMIIKSLLDSGLVVTAALPIHTEMKGRMRATNSAALASSIYMVARKIEREKLGIYRDVKKSLKKHIANKLKHFWEQGISGADFFISAIGSSIEIFGKYEKIVDDQDKQITVKQLLDDVRKVVTDFALKQVLHNDFSAEISSMTRLYILWRWTFRYSKISFDDALKISQSIGIRLEHEVNKGFIKKDKEFIQILDPTERHIEKIKYSRELIDVLHSVVLLWKNNKREEIISILKESGYGNNDTFYRVAQAISEISPRSPESKLIDGFLSGKSKIMQDIELTHGQTKLL